MKKKFRKVLTICMILAMMMGLAGCGGRSSQIKDTIEEFEYACRNVDVNAMLKCVDPAVSDPIRLALAFGSAVSGYDYEDMLFVVEELFTGSTGLDIGKMNIEEFLKRLSITDLKIKAKKSAANVECNINYEIAGQTFSRETVIHLIKYDKKNDKKWYISGLE